MLVSMNWIQDYVNLDGLVIPELLKRFTLSTAEIDEIYYKGKNVSGIVVGQIVSVSAHPESEKLHLLRVNVGAEVLDCVCSASNVSIGLKVPFARPGSSTVDDEIVSATVAGYISEGMCCSEKEIGISDNHTGLMIIDDDAPIGVDIKSLYPIEDVVFELDNKSLTNRPDLWGHYGIAREFAAITGRDLNKLPQTNPIYFGSDTIPVSISRPDLCFRYSCLRMNNVTRRTSPISLKVRLFYCGMRSLNFLTDLTNYIMLEIGQPLHAFDATKVSSIVVRTFSELHDFTTLDKISRKIEHGTLMICNDSEPVAIAGIMGGLESEIMDTTDSLVLEAACFDAISIRKSATQMGLRTDASMRYEKSLDPEMTLIAIRRFVNLMADFDNAAMPSSTVTDVYPFHYPSIAIDFNKKYVDWYSGIDIPSEQIKKTLISLGFAVEQIGDDDAYKVTVPSWRATKDVSLKADLLEEITRIYGYDNFIITSTSSLLKPVHDSAARANDRMFKDVLVLRHKLHEVHSYIWCDEKKYRDLGIDVENNVTIINGASGNNVLRNSLLPTLLVAVNDNKAFSDSFGIFEIGKVVHGIDENGLCNERRILGIVLFEKNGKEEALYYEMVGMVNDLLLESKHLRPSYKKVSPFHKWQHPKNTSLIFCNGTEIGTLSTLHPSNLSLLDRNAAVVCLEIDMNHVDLLTANQLIYREPSRFPSIDYDLTIRLERDGLYQKAYKILTVQNLTYLTSVNVVDVYHSSQGTNVTIRLIFSSDERTLSRDEVQTDIDRLIEVWKQNNIELTDGG